MDDKNFYDEINEKKFMLTMFYAPWCGACNSVEPEFKAAAIELAKDNPPAYLGVVNADDPSSKGLVKHLDVKGYPTFIWWDYGVRMPFEVSRERASIIKFVRQQTGVIATTTTKSKALKCEEIEQTKKDHKYSAFIFSHTTTKMFNFYQEL